MKCVRVVAEWCVALLVSSSISALAVIVSVRAYQQLAAHLRGVHEALGRLFSAVYWCDAVYDLPALIAATFILALPFAFVATVARKEPARVPNTIYHSAAGASCALFWVVVVAIVFGAGVAERFSAVDILERVVTPELALILLAGAVGGYSFARQRNGGQLQARPHKCLPHRPLSK